MIDLYNLRLGIWTWIDAVYFMPEIIWMFENAPRPKDPYFGLNILNQRFIGEEYKLPLDTDGFTANVGIREANIEINIFNTINAISLLDKLATTLTQQAVRELLASYGLYYVKRNFINNITTLLDTKFERRAIMEVTFRYTNQGDSLELYGDGWFETVSDPAQTFN